jgi:hypothetical protein
MDCSRAMIASGWDKVLDHDGGGSAVDENKWQLF